MAPVGLLLALLFTFTEVHQVTSHGRLMNPPARNAMWRFGFPNPVNYNDNEVFCGGVGVMYSSEVAGKCGVCGDSWLESAPRKHESGGIYATGLKGRRYTPGQIIDIEIELTANHWGYFELRLCPLEDPTKTERQECFNKYPLTLEGKSTSRFQIPEDTKKQEIFNYRVKLPDGVTCTHCVIQWIYYTGNTWGICENGTEAVGCGQQETFRNCADVAIITNTGGFGPNGIVPAAPTSLTDNPYAVRVLVYNNETKEATTQPLIVRSQVCLSHTRDKSIVRNDDWCMQNCLKYPPVCPPEDCQCLTECYPTGEYASKPGTDVYCHINCMRFPQTERCPSWCECK